MSPDLSRTIIWYILLEVIKVTSGYLYMPVHEAEDTVLCNNFSSAFCREEEFEIQAEKPQTWSKSNAISIRKSF